MQAFKTCKFLNFHALITAICRITYFHIENIGRNLLSYNVVLLLFMHLVVVDEIILIPS